MAVDVPRDAQHAAELLRDADLDTPEGREQVEITLNWYDREFQLGRINPSTEGGAELSEQVVTSRHELTDATQRAETRSTSLEGVAQRSPADFRASAPDIGGVQRATDPFQLIPGVDRAEPPPASDVGPRSVTGAIREMWDDTLVLLGAASELGTARGQRFIEALTQAASEGDEGAYQRLLELLDDEDVFEPAVKSRIQRAVNSAAIAIVGRELEPGGAQGDLATDEFGVPLTNQEGVPIAQSEVRNHPMWQPTFDQMMALPNMTEERAAVATDLAIANGALAEDTPLGVEPGFTFQGKEPQYYEDDIAEPRGYSPELVARLQRRLINAGLLSGTFAYGMYDETTRNAYTQSMVMANQHATDVFQITDQMIEGRARLQGTELPDRDRAQTVATQISQTAYRHQQAKEMLTRLGNREPTPREVRVAMMVADQGLPEEVDPMRVMGTGQIPTGTLVSPSQLALDPGQAFDAQFQRVDAETGQPIGSGGGGPARIPSLAGVFNSARSQIGGP